MGKDLATSQNAHQNSVNRTLEEYDSSLAEVYRELDKHDRDIKDAKRKSNAALREVRQATRDIIGRNLLAIATAAGVIAAVIAFCFGLYLYIEDAETDLGRDAYLWLPPLAGFVIVGLLALGILIISRSRDTSVSDGEDKEEVTTKTTTTRQRRRYKI
jgi:hypothetical protein